MTTRRSRTRKILVVDDSQICCDFVRMVMEEASYTVLTLTSHFGFVKMLREEKPDLVLIDVTMPILSGPKLVELARSKRRHECPILLYSDRDEKELAQLAAACGADGYIRKTNVAADLMRSVSRYVLLHANP